MADGDPMSSFSPRVREWFAAAFAAPTPVQAMAWPAIARGENVLLSAPTGSGKTLAAFLWALDRLGAGERVGNGTRVVYVSPLKALAYDIERNLRAPLRGMGTRSSPEIGVGIRTGDTPRRERAAMLRKPPDILITTPESLYLLLSSRARVTLSGVEAVIVDEIHAVAQTKRGSHLALTLERLEAQAREDRPGAALQRIGLSATQRPLQEIGRYLVGPRREVTILDAGVPPALDLRIEVPVESMGEPDARPPAPESGSGAPEPVADPLEPVPGGESLRGSIWPAIYPELLRLVREHNSTIVFVNNRRSAERVALRLNELAAAQREGAESAAGDATAATAAKAAPPGEAAPVEIARAHHGSLAREERTVVEELLKSGRLPCLVATSSLELGIDMGAVDLVLQIESPKSVARGLQRIGRAGHGVGEVSRGRIFPKFRGDLLECAVLAKRMREGAIESTVVPRNALDVLAQQIVAIAVSAEGDGVSVDDLYALVTSTWSYAELSRGLLENVLDMLDGRYPSREFGELRARIVWDRVAGTIRARRGARQLVVTNAGTIPDRGLYAVTLPDGRRVGELDEEMVYEARPGQAFLLGASAWRIEEIGRDRVIVTPAPGAPGAVPFWKGDAVGRPRELGEAIGAFSRWAVEQEPAALESDYALDERAARNLLDYLREQQAATRVLPSDRTIVLERFRDEIGDWRLCLLSPYGGRVHAAWGLALSARIREQFGVQADAIWSDDGIVLHLPDLDAGEQEDAAAAEALPSPAELVLIEPDEVEAAIVAELGDSALFGARFREAASRALLIPRAYPGKRTPLWQQRLKAQNLLQVARRYADFPIVLETYRECLRDVLDVPGLQSLLRDLHAREISLVEVETQTASPFASSLLFDYVATYMYEGDAPSAERRAAALSLDRELLRELLGSEELRELIDPGALAQVQDELQRRTELTRATDRDSLHDVLRRVGDLTREEVSERVLEGIDADALLAGLQHERRAIRVRVGGEERYIAADEAGLYRDALGAVPGGGLPEAFLADVDDALRELIARYARTHGPFTAEEVRERYRVDASAVLRELESAGDLVLGELRPTASIAAGQSAEGEEPAPAGGEIPEPSPARRRGGGSGGGREWCDVEVLRRLRRASLAVLRREVEPAERTRLAAFMPSWQGVDRHSGAGAGIDRLREVLVPLQGLALPVEIWERDVLARRTGAYSPTWLDALCASGEVVWVGAGTLGRSGRVALYFRDDAPAIGPPAGVGRRAVGRGPGTETKTSTVPIGTEGAVTIGTGRGANPGAEKEVSARGVGAPAPAGAGTAGIAKADSQNDRPEIGLLRARLAQGPCFFTDLLAEIDAPAEALREALWDLVWSGEVTNDAWAPLRAPRLTLARGERSGRGAGGLPARPMRRTRFGARRTGAGAGVQVQGRWSPAASIFRAGSSLTGAVASPSTTASSSSSSSSSSSPSPPSSSTTTGRGDGISGPERRRALAELLLERYGIVTREQVLAERIEGGFAGLYDTFCNLETLGVCRRGYFIEGMGGAQFALPGAVERLRATPAAQAGEENARTLVIAAADPAQPYGAALPWPRDGREKSREGRRPARVAGAHVVLVAGEPVLYVERRGRGLITLVSGDDQSIRTALRALADAVHAGRIGRLALERIDGEPAVGSRWEGLLSELGFSSGPRRLTLSA